MTAMNALRPIRGPKHEAGPGSPKRQGPLGRLAEAEIEYLLRGFSADAVAGALRLRTDSKLVDFETCLFGILWFYRPSGVEDADVVPSGQVRLHQDLGVDSLSMSEAIFKIEELFGISIENGEVSELETVADARRLLEAKLGARVVQ